MATLVASLVAEITGDSSGLTKALGQASSGLKSTAKELSLFSTTGNKEFVRTLGKAKGGMEEFGNVLMNTAQSAGLTATENWA